MKVSESLGRNFFFDHNVFPHFFILLSPQFPHKLLISAAFLLVLLLPSPSEAQLRREVNKHAGRHTLVSRFVSFQESSLTFLPCVSSTADRRGEEEEEERGRETKQEKEMAFPLAPSLPPPPSPALSYKTSEGEEL